MYDDLDLSTDSYNTYATPAPSSRPRGRGSDATPSRPLSGVELGVVTIAAAVAVVTSCVVLSMIRGTNYT